MKILWEKFDFDPDKYLNELVAKDKDFHLEEESEVPCVNVQGMFRYGIST
jgi:hypothetical protein